MGYKNQTVGGWTGGEHEHVAARALGKPLPKGAEVHHVDGNPENNRPDNLVICQDATYHALLHRRARALKRTGDPSAEDPRKNVAVSEAVWRKAKQRALDEGVSLREVVERAVHQYLGPSPGMTVTMPGVTWDQMKAAGVKGLAGNAVPPPDASGKHWTLDD